MNSSGTCLFSGCDGVGKEGECDGVEGLGCSGSIFVGGGFGVG